ncbi:MAG: hypothetical protein ACJ8F7_04110 [Gemmataceae bacterium]
MSPKAFRTAALLLLVAGPAFANPGGKDAHTVTAEAIRKALDEPVTLEVTEQPLIGVLAQLADLGKIPIVLDRNAMQISEASEANVSLQAKNLKLKTAIRTLIAQHGLSFGIVGDHVLVSTEEVVCQRQLRQRVSLDLDDVPLPKALKDLSSQTGTNVVLDPRSTKKASDLKVSLKLDDVPLETAVRILAEMAGLKPARMGNVLFVTSEDRADKLKDADHLAGPSILPGVMMPGGPGGPGGLGGAGAMPPAAVPAPMKEKD